MKNQSVRISLLYCSNALSTEEINAIGNGLSDIKLSSISLPCSGKVSLLYILKAIETGSDGVVLAACKLGECKYLQGNYRARKRIEYVDELLSETDFESGRARFVSMDEDNRIDSLLSVIHNLAEKLRFELREVQD
jgi:coenzyme F420-reducing hydrogenase delta subunit